MSNVSQYHKAWYKRLPESERPEPKPLTPGDRARDAHYAVGAITSTGRYSLSEIASEAGTTLDEIHQLQQGTATECRKEIAERLTAMMLRCPAGPLAGSPNARSIRHARRLDTVRRRQREGSP